MLKIRWHWGIGLLAAALGAWPAGAIEQLTAKQAVNLANQQVEEHSQKQVLLVEGKQSDSQLRPRIWDVALYDHKRANGAAVVRVKDGAVTSLTGSVRLFDDARWSRFDRNFTGFHVDEVVKLARWKVDSDEVVAKAVANPRLSGHEVTAVTLAFHKLSDGDVPPIWRIKLRARPKDQASRERWVGYLQFNAESGELIKDELRVKSARP